jgi:hypothetical protein
MPLHRNKTFATLLATTTGGLGLHRFYLRGIGDIWGWLHLATVPLSLLALWLAVGPHQLFQVAPFVLSVLIGCLEALVLGLKPDTQWDATYNTGSGKRSESHWPLALLLVITLALGATTLIAVIARTFDLLITGGAFG